MQMYAVVPEEMMDRDTRMTLISDSVLPQYGGKLKAGTCVIVPAQTAKRWRERGIAVDSAETDKTVREQKIAQMAALQAEIDAIPEPVIADNGESLVSGLPPRQVKRG